MLHYVVRIQADRHHFYIEEEGRVADPTSDCWTPEEEGDRILVRPGRIGVGTASAGDVEVEIEVQDCEPTMNLSGWDHVTQCSIETSTGRLLLYGGAGDTSKAIRAIVPPGSYQVRIYGGGMSRVDPATEEGEDYYRVQLWEDPPSPPHVLKRYVAVSAVPAPGAVCEPTAMARTTQEIPALPRTTTEAPPRLPAVPADLKAWINRAIAEFSAGGESRLRYMAGEIGVLPLSYDPSEETGFCVAINARGELVRFLVRDHPGYYTLVRDPNVAWPALSIGASKYPELSVLVPSRPAGAVTCPSCGGGALPPEQAGPCVCGGLGWRLEPQ
jgi:hypothetical protein